MFQPGKIQENMKLKTDFLCYLILCSNIIYSLNNNIEIATENLNLTDVEWIKLISKFTNECFTFLLFFRFRLQNCVPFFNLQGPFK